MELQDARYVALNDRRGNVAALLHSDTGQVVESYDYNAFGNETITTQKHATNNPWRFASKRVDAETGLVYFGRRYYDPSLGTWLTHDPLGLKEGPNLYAYVLNNPLTKFDMYGLWDADNNGAGTDVRSNRGDTHHEHTNQRDQNDHPFSKDYGRDRTDCDSGVRYETPNNPFISGDYWDDKQFYEQAEDEHSLFEILRDYAVSFLVNHGIKWTLRAVEKRFKLPAGLFSTVFEGLKAREGKHPINPKNNLGKRIAHRQDKLDRLKWKFPKDPNDLLPNLPKDAKGHIYPADNLRIRPERHELQRRETYSPRHHGQHYHVEKRIDPQKGWNKNYNIEKIKPPGYKPGEGTGFIPGEPFPGA